MTLPDHQNQVSKSKFKARALAYFRWIQETGKSLTITDRGHPVAKIIPFREDSQQTLTELRGSVIRYDDPIAPVGSEDWEANN